MESSNSNAWALVGAGFVVGAAFGGLVLPELRGYSSFEECSVREINGKPEGPGVSAAYEYCSSLFPDRKLKTERGTVVPDSMLPDQLRRQSASGQ
ncbi:hypothetical protein [Sandarakinorhabdus sp.]|uniref:hypothetical protein n=1 Tax=Sandarakinorhabdus sp. TaxID=1916663 RepID=UPI003341EC24